MQRVNINLNKPLTISRRMTLPAIPHSWMVIAVLGAIMLLWASAFTGVTVALQAYTPIQLAFARYMVASAVLLLYAIITRMPVPRLRDVPGIFFTGALGFGLYNVALNAGQQTVSPGIASFIASSEVGVMALMAAVFLGERLSRWGWIGIIVSFAGVAMISFAGDMGLELSGGVLLVMVSTLSTSAFSIMQKPYLRRYSATQYTTYAIWGGTLSLLPFASGTLGAVHAAPLDATLSLIYLGVLPGALAYVGWSYVLSHMDAARAGSYLTIIPVMALFIAWLWLGDVPTMISLIGGSVVLAGVLLVNR